MKKIYLFAAVFLFVGFLPATIRGGFLRGLLLTAFFYFLTVMSETVFCRLAVSGEKEEDETEN